MHYFANTVKDLIDRYGVNKAIEILNKHLSGEDGNTLDVPQINDAIRYKYLKRGQ